MWLLSNDVIDTMEERLLGLGYMPDASDIQLIFDETPQGSKLQQFVVDYRAAAVDWDVKKLNSFLSDCPHTFLVKLIQRKDKYPYVPNADITIQNPPDVRAKTHFAEYGYHHHEIEEEKKQCSARSTL